MRNPALAVGIVSAAAMMTSLEPVSAQQTRQEYRRMNWAENLPEAVRTFQNRRFTIVSYRTANETGHHPSPGSAQQVEAIRAAARSNQWLVGQLRAKRLTPNDIEWVTRARNGNMVFYVE
ncbi:hypothetical protein AM571_CH02477 [Rhizobium etli 8C-3]|uniref:Uncharacterized protein n=2 Tax=Rhizobium TaxID=379 RepID=A0A1L5P560_RHIET|nr:MULTISPECIES: hypothetical protein [Rhizobium]APO75286.1 hypothetical protein AM571_CH02477 [Rhizobium etli 8C-3]TCU40093.1 hypothetical protein EV129_102230 [Rhizobium azibense]